MADENGAWVTTGGLHTGEGKGLNNNLMLGYSIHGGLGVMALVGEIISELNNDKCVTHLVSYLRKDKLMC